MRITRRAFVSGGVATGAGLLASRTFAAPHVVADQTRSPWIEATIPDLQALLDTGQLTSRELTQSYLSRIDALNPLLRAVIETNPDAVANATRLDAERRSGQLRGPLHGIPVLLKDNIA